MDIKKYDWIFRREWYIQGFNAVPLLINHGGSSIPRTWKSVGYGYQIFLNQFANDSCEMYYDIESMESIYNEIKGRLKKDKNYLKEMRKQAKKELRVSTKIIEKVKKLGIRKLSNEKFLELFRKINDAYPYTLATNHIIEPFSIKTEERVKELLLARLEELGQESNFSRHLSILTTPTEKSEIFKAARNISKIIDSIKSKNLLGLFRKDTALIIRELKKYPGIEKSLNEHSEKYFWIASSYARAPIAGIQFFINDIKRHLKEHEKQGKDFVTKEEKNRLIKKLGIKGELADIIGQIDFVMIWQDERKKEMLSHCCYVDMFAKEAAKRFSLKHENILYLLPKEITEKNLKTLTDDKLAERRKGCIVIYVKDKPEIMHYGADYGAIMKQLKKHDAGESVDEIRGVCASIGKVVGRARICKSLDDIATFNEGEVLVSSMTRPEFMSAIRKSVAIVTDEGGITCHAAIISRELGIPCVIATKIATKKIHNGDLLEVAANHSRIIILEKAKS